MEEHHFTSLRKPSEKRVHALWCGEKSVNRAKGSRQSPASRNQKPVNNTLAT